MLFHRVLPPLVRAPPMAHPPLEVPLEVLVDVLPDPPAFATADDEYEGDLYVEDEDE